MQWWDEIHWHTFSSPDTITGEIDCCVYNASVKKNDQTKTMLHKSLTKWYFHLLNNFPLSNPPSSEAATAHKKWSVPWTAPPAYRLNMTSTTTTTITVTTFAEILTCVVRHSFLMVFPAKLSPLYRRQMDSLLHLIQLHVSSVICIHMEPDFLPLSH